MAEQFKHGYALLIAVDGNLEPSAGLPAVAKDVEALRDVLVHPERCGYARGNVKLLKGPDSTRAGIFHGLDWLTDKINADTSGNATAVIYYTGHGHIEGGEHYFIPFDVNLNRIKTSAIAATAFAEEVAALNPKRLLVMLDCCHAAGMGVKDLGTGAALLQDAPIPPDLFMQGVNIVTGVPDTKGLEALATGRGRAVLTSSGASEQSYVRRDRSMSIFTYHLIEALTGHAQPQAGATQVLVSDVMGHVTRRVPPSAQSDWSRPQNPNYLVSGNFPVALLLGGKGLDAGQPAPDPLVLPQMAAPSGPTYNATLSGSGGAIAQGTGARAVSGGVQIGGSNNGGVTIWNQVFAGGAYFPENVQAGGDVVGRDKIILNITKITQGGDDPEEATSEQESRSVELPQPLPGYAGDSGVSLGNEIPFDAGLRWGLERGPYSAVWGERAGPDLLLQLRRIEALLQKRVPQRFPRRFWIGVDLDKHAAPPTNFSELLELGSEGNQQVIPGVVIHLRSLAQDLLISLEGWIYSLTERVAQNRPLALIVETPAPLAKHPRLHLALHSQRGQLETLVMANDSDPCIDPNTPFQRGPLKADRNGLTIEAWIHALATRIDWSEGTSDTLRKLLDRHDHTSADFPSAPSAWEVVADLDAQAHPESDRALLEAVDRYWPERIASLVRAFAVSERSDARRLPLELADSQGAERRTLWLRAWIAGATSLSREMLGATLDGFRHSHTRLMQDLIAAALRQSIQHPTCDRCKDLLNWFSEAIHPTPDLSSILEYRDSGIINAREVLKTWGADRFILALRAGLRLLVRPGDLDNVGLLHPDPWWMVAACAPNADLIESLTRLDRDRRAIFGLLSAAEREKLALDGYLTTTIAECRRSPYTA